VNVNLAELDRLMADIGPKVVSAGEGFTLGDVMARYGTGRTTSQRRIDALIKSGKAQQVGVRPGPGQEKVYALTKSLREPQGDEN